MTRRRLSKMLAVISASMSLLTSSNPAEAHEKGGAPAPRESGQAGLPREPGISPHAKPSGLEEAEPFAAPAAAEALTSPEASSHSSGSKLGSLHPPAVHFPIALLLSSVLAEGLLLTTRDARYAETTRFMVRVAAPSALIAAMLGWFAGGFAPGSDDSLLRWHRWLGTGTASLAVVLLWLSERAARSHGRLAFRVALALAGVLAAVTGVLGGELVHAAIAP